MNPGDSIDISVFPNWKQEMLALVNELDSIYTRTDMSVGCKANHFHRILKKHGSIS